MTASLDHRSVLHPQTQSQTTKVTTNHNLAQVQGQAQAYGVIENAQRHFEGSLLGCFEYVPYTALAIVLIIKTINVRLD